MSTASNEPTGKILIESPRQLNYGRERNKVSSFFVCRRKKEKEEKKKKLYPLLSLVLISISSRPRAKSSILKCESMNNDVVEAQ